MSDILAGLVFVVIGGFGGVYLTTRQRDTYRCPKCKRPLDPISGMCDGAPIKFKCTDCEIIWDTRTKYWDGDDTP
ncbi:MAG: hypothetical protein ACYSU0_17995 [Planctomycetota bacterium]